MAIAFFTSCGARSITLAIENTPITDNGVVVNGIRWATRNVDMPGIFVQNPEDFGMFYQWNSRKAWNSTNEIVQNWDYSTPTGTMWYAQNDPCPRGWRVPTREELKSLATASIGWTTRNGVNGRLFGTADNHIFLPVAGGRNVYGRINNAGIIGFYWGKTQYNEKLAWRLQMDRSRAWVHRDSSRPSGLSVRCVAVD